MRYRLPATAAFAACLTGVIITITVAGPAAAAGSTAPAPVPCAKVSAALVAAKESERITVAISALERKCRPIPPMIEGALRTGEWNDGVSLAAPDRTILLVRATEAAYPEAETLAVSVIETGSWPDSAPLDIEPGSQVIRSLKGVLTTYRVHLLLDVFEQVKEPMVRQAVIQTLRGSKRDEALLPALEAAYEESGTVQEAAATSISEQPEKALPAVHARLIRTLPEGALLNWALRLANRHPSSPVAAARKARGLPD
jgi:hypothetical protein